MQRVARLLRHIAEGDAVTNVSRTARVLGINRTTLLRLLHTLEAERFIEQRHEGNGWRIGVGLIGLTAQAFFSEDLVQTAVPVLTRLAETLGGTALVDLILEEIDPFPQDTPVQFDLFLPFPFEVAAAAGSAAAAGLA